MQRVLVVCGSEDKISKVGRVIEEKLPFQVFSVFDAQNIQNQIKSRIFNIAVFDFETVNKNILDIVNWMREMDCSFPILLACKKVDQSVAMHVGMLSDVHVLNAPITEKNLVGLVKKLMVVKKVPKQIYRRFDTNQMAQMEALTSGESLFMSMYNLSKGGAYCEFDSPSVLSVGDLFKFKVVIDDTNSEYTLNAKVVWTTQRGRFSGRSGCGFKFVSTQDTYKYLLSKT